jgi:ATP-dependent Lon protease
MAIGGHYAGNPMISALTQQKVRRDVAMTG